MLTKLARAPPLLSNWSPLLLSSSRPLSLSNLLFQHTSAGANTGASGKPTRTGAGTKQQQSQKEENDPEQQSKLQEGGRADKQAVKTAEQSSRESGSSSKSPSSSSKKDDHTTKMITVEDSLKDLSTIKWQAEWKGKRLYPHDQWPERDLVNFPPHKRSEGPSPTRWYFVPESWFRFFYEKTGVTGPYMFFYGALIFGFSKEYIVLWYDFSQYLIFTTALIITVKKLGPFVGDLFKDMYKSKENDFNDVVRGSKAMAGKALHMYEQNIERAKNQNLLGDIRKEILNMQLEAAYRERMRSVYEAVKRRLDYQVALQNARKDFERSNMIDWITTEVRKAITAKQEQDTLQACLQQLKRMATSSSR